MGLVGGTLMLICERCVRFLKWDFSTSLLAMEVSEKEVVLQFSSDFPANL